ncbi:ATP-binding protein [Marinobacter salicampi]|uniref:ATP-binding protein n=1 Tax=Marinobacter salicampi TaxID=435907 RepID=UPI001409DB07|nr:ATP-binding protein [Marinobacter salicampi]
MSRLRFARPVFASLRLNLVISIVLPLMILSGAAIYIGLSAVESRLEERLREDLELVATAASGPLSQAMSEQDEIVLSETLKSIFRIGRVYGASVYDREGRQIASLGITNATLNRSRRAAEVIDSGRLGGDFRRVEGVDVFSQFTPLIARDGRIKGLLQITRKRSDFQDQIAMIRTWGIVTWSILSLIVTLVVVLGHYGSIGRHVSRLLGAMDNLAPGRWTLATTASGPREIRDIHEGLRTLAQRMAVAEREIVARMKREQALAERLEYQEKIAMIGRVAGGVAHELGAPLSVIQGRAGILARTATGADQQRQLADIHNQVERMTRIIEQLLDCFRHVPDSRRPVDLGKVLRETLVQLVEDPKCQGASLQVHGVASIANIEAEPTRLSLACMNVARNACQASRFCARVSLIPHADSWEVRVEDDGPGIAPELHEQIFEPFYSTRPAGEGTGLGLAVVNSVIKEHQGRLEVAESELGGCRMSLIFPRATAGAHQDHSDRKEAAR